MRRGVGRGGFPGPDGIRVEREDWVGAKEREGAFQAAAGFEDAGIFARYENAAGGEVGFDLVGQVMGVGDDAGDACGIGEGEGVVDQGSARNFDQGFRPRRGQRAHAGAEACGEEHQRWGCWPHWAVIL